MLQGRYNEPRAMHLSTTCYKEQHSTLHNGSRTAQLCSAWERRRAARAQGHCSVFRFTLRRKEGEGRKGGGIDLLRRRMGGMVKDRRMEKASEERWQSDSDLDHNNSAFLNEEFVQNLFIYIYIYIYACIHIYLNIIIYTILHACFYMTVHSPFLLRSKKDKESTIVHITYIYIITFFSEMCLWNICF